MPCRTRQPKIEASKTIVYQPKKLDRETLLKGCLEVLVHGNPAREENNVYNDKFRVNKVRFEVDTCVAFDTKEWETGVHRGDESWVIVEAYENESTATLGHEKWVLSLKQYPKQPLADIHLADLVAGESN